MASMTDITSLIERVREIHELNGIEFHQEIFDRIPKRFTVCNCERSYNNVFSSAIAVDNCILSFSCGDDGSIQIFNILYNITDPAIWVAGQHLDGPRVLSISAEICLCKCGMEKTPEPESDEYYDEIYDSEEREFESDEEDEEEHFHYDADYEHETEDGIVAWSVVTAVLYGASIESLAYLEESQKALGGWIEHEPDIYPDLMALISVYQEQFIYVQEPMYRDTDNNPPVRELHQDNIEGGFAARIVEAVIANGQDEIGRIKPRVKRAN